jgi:hypothetical protein
MIKYPLPFLFVKFSEVPLYDDFVSPEGCLCRKQSDTTGSLLASEDELLAGVVLEFESSDEVEYVPRRANV